MKSVPFSSELPLLGCFITVSETRPKQAAILCEASLQLFDFSHGRCHSATRSALPGSSHPFVPTPVHHSILTSQASFCAVIGLFARHFFGLFEYRLGRF